LLTLRNPRSFKRIGALPREDLVRSIFTVSASSNAANAGNVAGVERARAALVGMGLLLVSAACTRASPPAETEPVCGASNAASAARVSFRAEVVPVLERSCAFVSCHGAAEASHGVLLAKGAPEAMHAALVGQVSARYTGQALVVPGDASRSFLVKKLDPGLCGLPRGTGGCGEPMPRKNPPLPHASRVAIARWIDQGAKLD